LNLTTDQARNIQKVIDDLTQERDKLRQTQSDFFASMRNNGGGGNNGGGRGGRGGNNNNGNTNNTDNQQQSDAEAQARREQFQKVIEQSRTGTETAKAKAIDRIGNILTKTQKTKFAALQGKPFDLKALNDGNGPNNPFNPGGGNFGPGGGGPGGGGPGGRPAGGTTTASANSNTGAQTKAGTPTNPATGSTTGTRGTTPGTTKAAPGR